MGKFCVKCGASLGCRTFLCQVRGGYPPDGRTPAASSCATTGTNVADTNDSVIEPSTRE